MANATPASIGRINASGSEDALFLKVFAGEVITSFDRASKTQGADSTRSISNGKSATFPVMGRTVAAYHTPGAEIVGSDVNHNEKVITINDLLISSAFLSNLEEAKNHWDVRSSYSTEIGRALAFQKDKHVLQTIGQAALTTTANVTGGDAGTVLTNTAIASATAATSANGFIDSLFDAAKTLDDKYVPSEGRICFLKPEMYYKLANATNAVNVDFSGGANGGVASGRVLQIAGIRLISVPHFVASNVNSGVDQGSATQGGSNPQAVNLTNFEGLVCHPSAVGTVKLMDLATEMEYDIRRQGTLMVAKYAMGHGVLRPESAVGIKDA
ncbi:putative capsid protein [Pelagibacter phage Hroenn EXVC015P]|nr:putative capsid protein [Pelagibacter phage Bylgja EXVC010P]QLF88301.1 putative capsid protein [Pelagibacter phage Himinglaeva EXVC011P]QLF88354.1 putative capsid protein [Pelagibacter phage Hroenn EXVC015P]QLF88599.1 putative capsid protein [Pelagibacter phage Unn EXVC019P]